MVSRSRTVRPVLDAGAGTFPHLPEESPPEAADDTSTTVSNATGGTTITLDLPADRYSVRGAGDHCVPPDTH